MFYKDTSEPLSVYGSIFSIKFSTQGSCSIAVDINIRSPLNPEKKQQLPGHPELFTDMLKYSLVKLPFDIAKVYSGLDYFLEMNDKSVEFIRDAIISGIPPKKKAVKELGDEMWV